MRYTLIVVFYLSLFAFNANANEPASQLCKSTITFTNEPEDFCMAFPAGRKICVSGHYHMDPRDHFNLSLDIVKAGTSSAPEERDQAIASIKNYINNPGLKTVITGYTNQVGEMIAIGRPKYNNIELFIEGDSGHFNKRLGLWKYLSRDSALAKNLSPKELDTLQLLALGPYFYLYNGYMRKQSPVHPSESGPTPDCDTNDPAKINVKACLTDRDADMAKTIVEQCKPGKSCYWVGGSAHIKGLAAELQKICSSMNRTDEITPPMPVPVPRPAKRPPVQ